MADLPQADAAREWLATMMLIRRFEERAGEMYARAKIGGFLHLSIGEEATIVGSARALRDSDYLISTYRSHGHAIVRGTPPENVMAELFGRVDGCCHGRGGSMHMFDAGRRFMGGYGIVGGNLPIAAGIALASDYRETDEVTLCTFGDGASNQGTFGETLNLAALWRLPVIFMVTNNQFGMGTALGRHSAVTDLRRKGESLGVPGLRCDGMDILDTRAVLGEAVERVRAERRAAAGGGAHVSLPRSFDGRPGAVPQQGGGCALARTRPDLLLCGAAAARGRDRRRRGRADGHRGDRTRGPGGRVRRRLPRSPQPIRSTTTSTCSTARSMRGTRLQRRPAAPSAAARRRSGTAAPARNDEIPRQLSEALAAGEAPASLSGGPPDGGAAVPRRGRRGPARGARPRRAGVSDGRGHRGLRRRVQGHRGSA